MFPKRNIVRDRILNPWTNVGCTPCEIQIVIVPKYYPITDRNSIDNMIMIFIKTRQPHAREEDDGLDGTETKSKKIPIVHVRMTLIAVYDTTGAVALNNIMLLSYYNRVRDDLPRFT